MLFHYNGHGVPKPTSNGEIWVFNRHYTQASESASCEVNFLAKINLTFVI